MLGTAATPRLPSRGRGLHEAHHHDRLIVMPAFMCRPRYTSAQQLTVPEAERRSSRGVNFPSMLSLVRRSRDAPCLSHSVWSARLELRRFRRHMFLAGCRPHLPGGIGVYRRNPKADDQVRTCRPPKAGRNRARRHDRGEHIIRCAAFPITSLENRLKCPLCGSRRVSIVFDLPKEPNAMRIAGMPRR